MADLIVPRPNGANDVTSNTLWTPTGVEYLQSWVVGIAEDEGTRAVKHEFRLAYKGHIEYFSVLAGDDEDEAMIEDMAAMTAERAAAQLEVRDQIRSGRITPADLGNINYKQIRQDVAGAIRDMRNHSAKRRGSSNNKIYYSGLH